MVGGLGLITASNFYLPQVNVPGSMGTFILPAAVPVPAPPAAPIASNGSPQNNFTQSIADNR
jgi:hypothetical protein